jgi:ankyrin repeat protein|tara:strand:+ start:49 stop:471 length:423 start_codon:yes stop_codon:yes gene_type:complete
MAAAEEEGSISLGSSSFVRAVYSTLKEQLAARRAGGTDNQPNALNRVRDALLPTLMCSAASIGNVAELQGMLADGADPGCVDYDLRSPLHIAASDGQLEATSVLLAAGADVNAVRFKNEYNSYEIWFHLRTPEVYSYSYS